jgi:hypothetical protein
MARNRTRIIGRGRLWALALATAAGLGLSSLHGQLPGPGQAPPAERPPAATRIATGPATRAVAVEVDRKNRRIILDAAVSVRREPLEFLLTTAERDYESLLTTKARPSDLHAALLAMGLMPGQPGRWASRPGKEPVFLPPKGAMLTAQLRWKDKQGQTHEADPAEWMVGPKGRKPEPTRYVFVGSSFLPDGRYWADVEGTLISVANFASTVVDVPFESSDKEALLEFAANPKATPPKGTPVQVILTPVKGAETAPVARLSMAIDRFGRIRVEGVRVRAAELGDRATKFLSRHSEGYARVWVDPRALVYDRDRVETILNRAGIEYVEFRTHRLEMEVLPRTPGEVDEAIDWWKDQFARHRELIIDPAEDAAAVLKQIEASRERLEQKSQIWAEYGRRLKELRRTYLDARRKEREGGDGAEDE